MDIPVIRLDHSSDGSAPTFVAMFADQSVQVHRLRFNRMRRQFDTTTTSGEVVIDDEGRGPPDYITTTGLGDNIYLIWREGILQRYDSRRLNNITLVETVDILPGEGAELTVVSNLIGRTTLLLGDSRGNVRGLFRVGPDRPVEYERRSLRPLLETVDDEEALLVLQEIMGTDTFRAEVDRELHASMGADNQTLAPVQLMSGDGAGAVTAISTSQRRRTIAVGHNDGRVRLHNVTNERLLAEIDTGHTEAVGRLVLNPRDSGLAAISGNRVQVWDVSAPHPESSMASLFTKVHYEGYSYPTHTWQSTGGTDNFESKYGMLPLIFGSLKATFFAMMFAVPVAIMAAIYTSEFLQPKMKSKVKPTIEMMASLPSVVLGFLAGLVVAQFIEDIVVAVLMAFFTVPFTFLLLSQIFQTLSAPVRMRIARWRFLVLILSLPIALYMAALVGPLVEGWLFWVEDPRAAVVLADGSIERNFTYNIRDWLSAHRQDFPVDASLPQFRSSAIGGWMILFMPVAALASLVLMTRYINPLMSTWAQQWTWSKLAFADAGKFLVVCLVAVVVAYLFSAIASLMVDGRGIFLDQYAQRNALIVGVIMGFAVIPIIYTIADDAMSAVPESLRSASLGAGATPWQTAVRVIIPTAMSGLFSAVMIGFGRAVGETMIVLMALGNTPIMELNIFSGARTLSANIAVEMMEAVKDSTNYRILFLAGLVLFIMTFVINTIAEAVRLHYRKKAAEL
ncbi:MAG: ABC transporter permease subunit [Planctomycetota bacterium]|nr:MAG: ABC transporter permease subunit [Planctomycetota bacterium]